MAWACSMKFATPPRTPLYTSSIRQRPITVSLWGTKEYDKIGPSTAAQEHPAVHHDLRQVEDLPGQGGVDGFITVDRVFYKDGEEVKEPITTTYKPAPEVICGKKPDKKPEKDPDGPWPPPSPSPSASETAKPSDKPSAAQPEAEFRADGRGRHLHEPSPSPSSAKTGQAEPRQPASVGPRRAVVSAAPAGRQVSITGKPRAASRRAGSRFSQSRAAPPPPGGQQRLDLVRQGACAAGGRPTS